MAGNLTNGQGGSAAPSAPSTPSWYNGSTPWGQLSQQQQQNLQNSNAFENQTYGPGQNSVMSTSPSWLTGTLSESNPLPWQQYMPTQTTGLANQIEDQAGLNGQPNLYAKELNTGINPNAGLAAGPGLVNNQGMNNSPYTQAIQNYAQQGLSQKMQALQGQIGMQSTAATTGALSTASDVWANTQKVALQNFQEQYAFQTARQQAFTEWQNAQAQASAQTISEIMGFAGPIIGASAGAAGGT